MEKNEKIKESKRKYGKEYNKTNISVQLDRNLINNIKKKLNGESLKSFIESLLKKYQ